jgi:hypothetical protein
MRLVEGDRFGHVELPALLVLLTNGVYILALSFAGDLEENKLFLKLFFYFCPF